MNQRSAIFLRRRLPVVLAATTTLAFASCSTGPEVRPKDGGAAGSSTSGTQPSGQPLLPPPPPVYYVNPDSPAAEQVARWTAEGRLDDATLLRKISESPTALWLTVATVSVREVVARYTGQARIMGQVPVLVTDNIPRDDCGKLDTGRGAPSATAYRRWIREVAAGLGGRDAIVILEPNSIPYLIDGCVENAAERYALLKDAITVLKSTGSARVYLDAGQPAWITDAQDLARALTRAGIARADGFALNVGGFIRTVDIIWYGRRVSDALGGRTHFVIDTSRNGNGPYPRDTVNGGPNWCNPPGRALGAAPTDATGQDRVDALLWIKYPGESDGACRPGEPVSGEWWPEYALDLARRSL